MTVHNGIKFNPTTSKTRAIKSAATSPIALIAKSGDGDDAYFPAGEMVSITNLDAAIEKAGDTGNLAACLETIASQCTPTQMVVIRVGDDGNTDDAEVNDAINSLLHCKTRLGFKPKILGIPGLETHASVATLASVSSKLLAMSYFRPQGATQVDAITDRAQYGARELCAIWPDFTGFEGQAIAAALGHRAYLDQNFGFNYSLQNELIQGVTGISKDVSWDISGIGTNAAALNDAAITTIIRDDGFQFWGHRTMSDDPQFAFEVAVRTDQFLIETIQNGLKWAMGKPITLGLKNQIEASLNAKFAQLQSDGLIIGALAWFDPSKNSAELASAGGLRISYKYTYTAPLEDLGVFPEITSDFYINLFN